MKNTVQWKKIRLLQIFAAKPVINNEHEKIGKKSSRSWAQMPDKTQLVYNVTVQLLRTDSADFLITLTADSISSFVSKALTVILMLGSGNVTSWFAR